MAKSGFLLFGATILLAITFQVDALKCWRCSSDSSTSAFCDDPFDPSIINEQQRRWAYVDCSFPPGQYGGQGQGGQFSPFNQYGNSNNRAVCKKMKQLINDRIVVSRSCAFEEVGAQPDTCMRQQTPSYIRTEFCETCGHDGCNSATKFTAATILALIPALFAFILAL